MKAKKFVNDKLGDKNYTHSKYLMYRSEIEELQEYAEQSKWIKCSDRLPKESGTYLCFLNSCKVTSVYFNSEKWNELWGNREIPVKYWQLLPKLTK